MHHHYVTRIKNDASEPNNSVRLRSHFPSNRLPEPTAEHRRRLGNHLLSNQFSARCFTSFITDWHQSSKHTGMNMNKNLLLQMKRNKETCFSTCKNCSFGKFFLCQTLRGFTHHDTAGCSDFISSEPCSGHTFWTFMQ